MEGFDPGSLLEGFSLYTILLAVLFGLVGFAAFRYGRKNHEPRPLFIGIALMAYGYFVTNAWISLAIGSLLTLGLFFPRD
jgi:MFS family permease